MRVTMTVQVEVETDDAAEMTPADARAAAQTASTGLWFQKKGGVITNTAEVHVDAVGLCRVRLVD